MLAYAPHAASCVRGCPHIGGGGVAEPLNVNDLLEGHAALDIECLDRVYLNAYVPNLQVGGQVVTFLTEHLGNPVPSPALFARIGNAFRASVRRFAEAEGRSEEHTSELQSRRDLVCRLLLEKKKKKKKISYLLKKKKTL